jgi:hypothetical protein
VDSRAARSAKNEALFREVNDRILDVMEPFGAEGLEALCECGDGACTETFEITLNEYRGVRARGNSFAMLADHEDPTLERVVARNDRFIVVEKIGEAAEVAQELEPRS